MEGADADLILDDTLIDIKTCKECVLKRRDFDQIIGYYLLAKIGGITPLEDSHKIRKIGIYFSRFGYLLKIPIDTIGSASEFDSLKNWFVEYVNKNFPSAKGKS